jgi:GNAT superfamily N-acetyltransferase
MLDTTGREALPPDERLVAHLRSWVGAWPPEAPLTVVEAPPRGRPGWDGRTRDVVGVASPQGAVLAVPAGRAAAVRAATSDWRRLQDTLPDALGRHGATVYLGTLRWSVAPADLPEVGVWRSPDDPALPEWLRPFSEVLVALERGRYAAGVGLKRHDRYGVELAVGTEPEHRGKGLASRLVAQAARRILAEGGVPTYIHDPANIASARTATTAGFPDRGWQVLAMPPVGDLPG